MASAMMPKKRLKRTFKQSGLTGVDEVESTAFAQEYGVVRTIFKHLNILDLTNASHVCRNWQSIAEIEKAHRTGCPLWFTFRNSANFSMWDTFTQTLHYKPSVCFTFSTTSLNIRKQVFDKIRKVTKFLECPQLTVGCMDLLHSIVYNELLVVENWYPVQYAFMLPSFPGATIVPFRLTPNGCRKLSLGQLPDCLSNVDMPVKSLLLFCTKTTLYGSRLAVKLQARQTEGIAIGGAIVRKLQYSDSLEGLTGVAFYGENVVASSVVLHDALEDMDDVMHKFRLRVVDGEHNIAFMFACGSRCDLPVDEFGHHLDLAKRYSNEATLFRNHFGMKHFLGILGDGEIGCTCLPVPYNTRDDDKPRRLWADKEEKIRHTYSVVLVHIAFNVPYHLRARQETKETLSHGLE